MGDGVDAYLGLGGNLGDRRAALYEALRLLDATEGLCLLAASSVYETEPWGLVEQPAFLNLAARFETRLAPLELLSACQRTESLVGRTPSYQWGPRLIDVDILLYGGLEIAMPLPDLQIPHFRLRERAFALVPLGEIAGPVPIPPDGATVEAVLAQVDGRAGVQYWGQIDLP